MSASEGVLIVCISFAGVVVWLLWELAHAPALVEMEDLEWWETAEIDRAMEPVLTDADVEALMDEGWEILRRERERAA